MAQSAQNQRNNVNPTINKKIKKKQTRQNA